MMVQVTWPAPDFTADAVVYGEFKEIGLSSYRGKHLVLFFYPLDFTFICPTELLAFSDQMDEFRKRGCEVLAVSVDSKYTHLAWVATPRKQGGVGPINYPIVSDLNKSISRSYGVLLEEPGVAVRATVPDRQSRHHTPRPGQRPATGRSVGEVLRLLDALQHYENCGELCPANWSKGMPGVKPEQAGARQYAEAANRPERASCCRRPLLC